MGGLLGAGPRDAGAERGTGRASPSRSGLDEPGKERRLAKAGAKTNPTNHSSYSPSDQAKHHSATLTNPWFDPLGTSI